MEAGVDLVRRVRQRDMEVGREEGEGEEEREEQGDGGERDVVSG